MWGSNCSLLMEKLWVLSYLLTVGLQAGMVLMARLCPSPSYLLWCGLLSLAPCLGVAQTVFFRGTYSIRCVCGRNWTQSSPTLPYGTDPPKVSALYCHKNIPSILKLSKWGWWAIPDHCKIFLFPIFSPSPIISNSTVTMKKRQRESMIHLLISSLQMFLFM